MKPEWYSFYYLDHLKSIDLSAYIELAFALLWYTKY